jgi:acetyl esterase/lipase
MNRTTFFTALLVLLGLSAAQAADIRRISLEGKDGKVLAEVAPVKTPAFVYVAGDDQYAPSAIAYAAACKERMVPCDFTQTEHGGHGFGLKPELPPDVKDWPDKLHTFLDGLK